MYSSDDKDFPLKNNKPQNANAKTHKDNWITISKVLPPDDIIIESLLRGYGIPAKLFRKDISQFPFATGPTAEVYIAVPEELVEDARDLLENRLSEL
ncbi:MAG: hypothetical protein ABFD18_15085 [Syntrophomonas sp.]